jgi:hypothetical protein
MDAIPDVITALVSPDKRIGYKFKIQAVSVACYLIADYK